jgi:serine/threonine protein kinase
MGVVFKARDPLIGRLIALKTITASVADDPGLLERFRGEAKAAGALQHPNIVTIYEMGEAEGVPFIAMEYLEGESLAALISRRAPLPLAQKVGYLVQTCRALQYAHRRGVIHRDIKPANIVVTTEGVVKVVDFGIARLTDSSKTQTGTLLGTLAYMSPQQLRGGRADARSDIWSMGVVLYELVTGRRPFQGENHAALLLSILQNDPVPLRDVLGECPYQLDAIVRRTLAKDDASRYQSMEELLLELKSAWAALHLNKAGEAPAEATPTAVHEYAMQPAARLARTQIAPPPEKIGQKIGPRNAPARNAPAQNSPAKIPPASALPATLKAASIPSVPIAPRTPAPQPSSPRSANLALANLLRGKSWRHGIAFAAIGLAVLAGIEFGVTHVPAHFSPGTSLPVTSNAPEPPSAPPSTPHDPVPAAASAIEDRPAGDGQATPDAQFNAALSHFNQAVAAKDAGSLKLRVRPEFQQIAQGGGPRAQDAASYLSSAIPTALRRLTPWPSIGCGINVPDRVNDEEVLSGGFVACGVLDPPNLQWVQFSWPEFPARARQAGLDNGVAMLSLAVDRRGVVVGAWSRAKRDSYGFVDSALQAALKWKVSVPRAAGKPVETQISVDVLFSQ